MWDLWWKKWHWGRFSPSTSVSLANSHPTNCCTLTYHHPGLVQLGQYWSRYQVDSVSPHQTEEEEVRTKKVNTPFWLLAMVCCRIPYNTNRHRHHYSTVHPLVSCENDNFNNRERFLRSTMLSSFSCNLLNIYVPCQFRIPASICISS
jgi:hypothetical protein